MFFRDEKIRVSAGKRIDSMSFDKNVEIFVFALVSVLFLILSSCENTVKVFHEDDYCTVDSSEIFITAFPDPYADYKASKLSNNVISRCGNFPCAFSYPYFLVWDTEKSRVLWKSTSSESERDLTHAVKNNDFAYIYEVDRYAAEKEKVKVKVIKFTENGIFEESEPLKLQDKFDNLYPLAVSESNIVVAEGWRSSDEEYKIFFFDMNNPEKGLSNFAFFDFDNQTLNTNETNTFVIGNVFWTSRCVSNENYRFYQSRCYAASFDLTDPENPKMGNIINIPGELVQVSSDGKYLYTKTPKLPHTPERGEISQDFYTIKLNSDKTALCNIRKETLVGYSSQLAGEDDSEFLNMQHMVYVKSGMTFVVTATVTYDDFSDSDTRHVLFGVRTLSASGDEIFKKSFEGFIFAGDVEGGGVILLSHEKWLYISPQGTETTGSFGEKSDFSAYDSLFLVMNAVLIDSMIYLPSGNNSVYSLTVQE